MPSGCLRARTSSASAPSSGNGARSYSSSASAALSRPPALTLSARSLIVGIVKSQRPVEVGQTELAGVPVKGLQPLELLAAEDVLDIIAQVAARHRLTRRVVRIVGRGDGVRLRHPFVARALQQPHVPWRERTGP